MSSTGIDALKELLFKEEEQRYLELNDKIKESSDAIEHKLANRELPDAEFNQILNRIVQIMPEKLGPTITETLKTQIKESRDEVVQALFPIVGQMIKKYVQQELQLLTERIDKQFNSAFSFELAWLRIRSFFTGTSFSELVLKSSNEPQLHEIFIIQEESGLLMASYSATKSFDQDMMSGMLTAIKSFVEDAMLTEKQNLEMISYDLYKIYVQNFGKFYVAVVLSGVIDTAFKSKLNDRILSFVKEVMMKSENPEAKEIKSKIAKYFEKLTER